VGVIKEFMLAQEQEKIAKKKQEDLKPFIEAARNKSQKKTFFPGKWRNVAGEFFIQHITRAGQKRVSVDDCEEALKRGIINAAAFEFLVKEGKPSEYNLVDFSPGV
jgi:CRISPR/Cas system-associated protein Csx1